MFFMVCSHISCVANAIANAYVQYARQTFNDGWAM